MTLTTASPWFRRTLQRESGAGKVSDASVRAGASLIKLAFLVSVFLSIGLFFDGT